MDMQPIDFSALDPTASPATRDRLVAAVMARAEAELARRAAAASPILMLARWARPALATAAMLAAVSLGAMTLLVSPESPESPVAAAYEVPSGIADELYVPAPIAGWVVADRGPTVNDVLVALEGDLP